MAKKKPNNNIKHESVEDALARGVKITRLPTSEEVKQKRIEEGEIKRKNSPNVKKAPISPLNIMGLGEAADFYGEKSKRKKKIKKTDFTGIDKDQIPKNLHYILEQDDTSAETNDLQQEKKED